MKESVLINQIIEYLSYKNIFAWRNNTMGVYDRKTGRYRRIAKTSRGVSDILGVLQDGKILCIECKTGKLKLSEYQTEFGEKISSNNGIFIVAYELEDVIERLEKDGYIK